MSFNIGMIGMKHYDGVGMRVVANILSFHHKGSVGRNIRHAEMGLTVSIFPCTERKSCLFAWFVTRHLDWEKKTDKTYMRVNSRWRVWRSCWNLVSLHMSESERIIHHSYQLSKEVECERSSSSSSLSPGRDVVKGWIGDPKVKGFRAVPLEFDGERIIVEYSRPYEVVEMVGGKPSPTQRSR